VLFLQERRLRMNSQNQHQNDLLNGAKLSPNKKRMYTSPMHSIDAEDGTNHSNTSASGASLDASVATQDREEQDQALPVFVKKVKVMMYNFGSPRVGNRSFAALYNKVVPNSFRVVVDGDIVAGLPPSKYQHIGTEILIDSLGAGSIIIDPSFVERWLRTNMKSSVAVHSLLVYRKGLLGLKLAAEYLKEQYERQSRIDSLRTDPLRLAIQMRNTHKLEQIIEKAPDFGSVINESLLDLGREHTASTSDIEAGPISITSSDDGIKLNDISPKGSVDRHNSDHSIEDERRRRIQHGFIEETKASEEEKINARHYAHDVENMTNLMAQIRQLQGSTGPVNWVKKHTVDRMKNRRINAKRSHSSKDQLSQTV
jgi:hypothetical protein